MSMRNPYRNQDEGAMAGWRWAGQSAFGIAASKTLRLRDLEMLIDAHRTEERQEAEEEARGQMQEAQAKAWDEGAAAGRRLAAQAAWNEAVDARRALDGMTRLTKANEGLRIEARRKLEKILNLTPKEG